MEKAKPKVITLEKAADGTYVVPEKPVIETEETIAQHIKTEEILEKSVPGYDEYQSGYRKSKRKVRKTKHVHEFIVNNGTKASEFLDGVQKTIKIINVASKLIK
jgi:hypothetical protein